MMYIMKEYIAISEAATMLGVNKKTLQRWDTSGKFPAFKEKISGTRYYAFKDIKNLALLFEIKRKHRENNKKLYDIRKEADKFSAIIPLVRGETRQAQDGESMRAAYKKLHEWKEEHKAILKSYNQLP